MTIPVFVLDDLSKVTRDWSGIIDNMALCELEKSHAGEWTLRGNFNTRCVLVIHFSVLFSQCDVSIVSKWIRQFTNLHVVVISGGEVREQDKRRIGIDRRIYVRLTPVIEGMDIEFRDGFANFLRAFESGDLDYSLLEPAVAPNKSAIRDSFLGGPRPTVVVLDDYNNYVRFRDSVFELLPEQIIARAAVRYNGNLREILVGYCSTLNDLSDAYHVIAPPLWLRGESPESDLISEIVPIRLLDDMRAEIAACIVDLEWTPTLGEQQLNTDHWKRFGRLALQLVRRRYPEIKCFVHTGEWTLERLQEALASGAAWCFRKRISHHQSTKTAAEQMADAEEVLGWKVLTKHLTNATDVQHRTFERSPYPEQLVISQPMTDAERKFLERLHVRLPLDKNDKGRSLQSLLAGLFPDGATVQPIKVFSEGKSKAQAIAFFKVSYGARRAATQLIKIAPWIDVQKEYAAYAHVIRPRLNSFVADIVREPVLAVATTGEAPIAALTYSVVGLPEDHKGLRSLTDLLKEMKHDPATAADLIGRLRETFIHVLDNLYRANSASRGQRLVKRPLWHWLGQTLPVAFTGELLRLDNATKCAPIKSHKGHGYKACTTWLLAAREARKMVGAELELFDFVLTEAEWEDGDSGIGQITVSHPDLGFRVRLRGGSDDIRRRFGANWVRSGLPVRVKAKIDVANTQYEMLRCVLDNAITRVPGWEACSREQCLSAFAECVDREFSDPFSQLCGKFAIPFSYTVSAHEGPIHGDLNLENIQFSGKYGPGWLIDFERADESGMLAFDLAKLEIEVWHHHVFPLLVDLAAAKVPRLRLLAAALGAVDGSLDCAEKFESEVRSHGIAEGATTSLLLPIKNLLNVISAIRAFGRSLQLKSAEMKWALGIYQLTTLKFIPKDHSWRLVFSFLASAWHLREVAPNLNKAPKWEVESESGLEGGLFTEDARNAPEVISKRDLDSLLLETQRQKPHNFRAVIMKMAEPKPGFTINWDDIPERWDLASTGSIANITPILGYLWLKVAAAQRKMVVPKISSHGASCGTVDILESGGLNFASDPARIVEICRSRGGVLCRQDQDLTPVDHLLMNRRRDTNTMKDAALTIASILSKKVVMGTTHVIIDVKAGRDTKLIAPWMDDIAVDRWIKPSVENCDALLLGEFASHLKTDILGPLFEDKGLDITESWLTQRGMSLGSVEEIRWFVTNADMPQCRAIGRHLILLHLDRLITGRDPLLLTENSYTSLYRNFLAKICGVANPDGEEDAWKAVKEQWWELKGQLPYMKEFAANSFFRDGHYLEPESFDKSIALSGRPDLRTVTMAVGLYETLAGTEKGMVKSIAAWKLDDLFEWLCGDEPYDPEVGIYLHKLPGESVDRPGEAPFISVFYRPSRCPEREVLFRLREFLREDVEIGS